MDNQEPICITEAQFVALQNLLNRTSQPQQPEWMKSMVFNDDVLLIRIWNMVIGIEADGYTHS